MVSIYIVIHIYIYIYILFHSKNQFRRAVNVNDGRMQNHLKEIDSYFSYLKTQKSIFTTNNAYYAALESV